MPMAWLNQTELEDFRVRVKDKARRASAPLGVENSPQAVVRIGILLAMADLVLSLMEVLHARTSQDDRRQPDPATVYGGSEFSADPGHPGGRDPRHGHERSDLSAEQFGGVSAARDSG